MKRVVCLLRGHAWEEDPDNRETYPVLRCKRCGRHRSLAAHEVDPAWVGRGSNPYPDGDP